MIRPALAGLIVLSLVGCHRAAGPVLKNALPTPLPADWTTVSDAESGVSLAIPASWRVGMPRSMPSPSGTEGEAGAPPSGLDPALAQMAQGMEAESAAAEKKALAKMREKEGIVLHCVDGSKPTLAEEPTRLYVKRLPDAGFTTLEEAAAAERADAHREMKVQTVDLPVGKAVRMTAQGRNRIGDEECHVSYVFIDGNDAYVLRFASTNAPDAILSIERGVAETFRVRPKAK